MSKIVMALVVAMVPALIGGTIVVERTALEFLTYLEAVRYTGPSAVRFAQGATISTEEVQAGGVLGYRVVSSRGLTLVDAMPATAPNIDVAQAIEVASSGSPKVDVVQGGTLQPQVYTLTYVPQQAAGVPVAVVVFADQTERYADYVSVARPAEIGLYAVLSLVFLIPGIAWFRQLLKNREATAQARFLADHDALTGVASRRKINDRLGEELARMRPGGVVAILSIDLDNFKDINDTLGHDVGDQFIKTVAGRLLEAIGDSAALGRVGGDEFLIVQGGDVSEESAELLAQKAIIALAQPYVLGEHEIVRGASIGIAVAPTDGTSSERLLKSADLALYHAKSIGRGVAERFRPEFDEQHSLRLGLERTIRGAVANNALRLHFQPLYGRENGQLSGFEALLRLADDDGNLIPPATFIPVAEKIGQIESIGNWVLGEACRAAVAWPEPLAVAVNLSVAQFRDGTLVENVVAALDSSGLLASRLELEVTESLLLADTDTVLEQLFALKRLGISIAMDDFGTGYSSLNYLWRFPFDRLKIDRSFIHAIGGADGVENIMKTIAALGRSLNMKVTVEGVESSDQAAFLKDFDCDDVQGFFFGRPQPLEELSATMLTAFRDNLHRVSNDDGTARSGLNRG